MAMLPLDLCQKYEKFHRQNVGTWRAMSERYGNGLFTMFPQTWHATFLHLPPHYQDEYRAVPLPDECRDMACHV
ncbi:MAG: hypothetical protein HDS84_05740 [Bacteroidales bacterium]|nr:hypothetical protein [Bacteroidales bacterium]